ncbi:class I SAM-dependent methyltransferase [Shouchella shacheensis]|uniref:class I SAM-dependent methyltransferase n=1 Tax=Shouchella shacheensis TaxID=1649580 RepID=UPI00073FCF34|nr:class I SAM-dependent methyltransferase [Shouchella shacheensis]
MAKKDVQQAFGKSAQAYVTSPLHAKGEDLLALKTVLQPTGTERLLDVATGAGHVVKTIAPHVASVTAIDITPEMLSVAETFVKDEGITNATFLEGPAEALPFEDASFDVVITRIAAHHFERPLAFVNEAARVLNDRGRLFILDNVAPEDGEMDRFYNEVEKQRDQSHVRAWKKSEWIQMVEKAGLNLASLLTFSKTFQFSNWTERMHLGANEKKELNDYMLRQKPEVISQFSIETISGQVQNFRGQSILLEARKRV